MASLQPLNHIEILRESISKRVRGKNFPNAPRVQPRSNRVEHSSYLTKQTNSSITSINNIRADLGITPNALLVLEFKVLSVNQREILRRAFGVSIVEETEINDTNASNFRLLVQFPNSEVLKNFEIERQLYSEDSQTRFLLPYAQRRDLFDALETIRDISAEDRKGPRLKFHGIPEDWFLIDIDLWYDGTSNGFYQTEGLLKVALNNLNAQLIQDLFRTPSLLLGKVRVNTFILEKLLQLDIIAQVDLPVKASNEESFDISSEPPSDIQSAHLPLDQEFPLAVVIDSGIFSGHPLLREGIVLEEYDFGTGEETETDLNGHGTGVAGIVVYGDISQCLSTENWVPKVRICSAKVLKNDPIWNTPVFPENYRPEKLLEDAIRYYHEHRGCRIFNLSIGNTDQIYNDGRQFSWAETLDNLSRELDIVIVVSAGNVIDPLIPEGNTRNELKQAARNTILSRNHKLIDPGTASICLVVGSIARREDSRILGAFPRIPITPRQAPSVFTRSGFGVNGTVKPDLVAPGGSFVLQQMGSDTRWVKNDPNIGEPSFRNTIDDGRWFSGFYGTSFSAPHVTHICALIEDSLKKQLGRLPSANLVRAMAVNSASVPNNIDTWMREAVDENDKRAQPRKQEYVLRTMGYGIPSESILWSSDNKVTLFAEEILPLNSFHVFNLRIPPEFLQGKYNKMISISLAYDPPVRLSRKNYTSNKLWFEVYRGLTAMQLEEFRRSRETGDGDELPKLPDECKTNFIPGYQTIQNSTVQLRKWSKGKNGGLDLFKIPDGQEEPFLTILVAGKEQFPDPMGADTQKYSLVVTFYAEDETIELYSKIQTRVRTRIRTRV